MLTAHLLQKKPFANFTRRNKGSAKDERVRISGLCGAKKSPLPLLSSATVVQSYMVSKQMSVAISGQSINVIKQTTTRNSGRVRRGCLSAPFLPVQFPKAPPAQVQGDCPSARTPQVGEKGRWHAPCGPSMSITRGTLQQLYCVWEQFRVTKNC